MEAFISSLGALSLMIGMAVILGIVALYMFLALVSSELGLEEKKKENPDEKYIVFFHVNAIFHLTTALLIIGHFAVSIVRNL